MAAVARCVLLLGLATGCVSAPHRPIADGAMCPRACETTSGYSLDARFTAGERAAIVDAMALWTRASGGRACFVDGGRDLFVYRGEPRDVRPYFRAWRATEGFHVGGVVLLIPETIGSNDWRAVMAHELGHYFGISHLPTRESVMHRIDGALHTGDLWPIDRVAYCAAQSCHCP